MALLATRYFPSRSFASTPIGMASRVEYSIRRLSRSSASEVRSLRNRGAIHTIPKIIKMEITKATISATKSGGLVKSPANNRAKVMARRSPISETAIAMKTQAFLPSVIQIRRRARKAAANCNTTEITRTSSSMAFPSIRGGSLAAGPVFSIGEPAPGKHPYR